MNASMHAIRLFVAAGLALAACTDPGQGTGGQTPPSASDKPAGAAAAPAAAAAPRTSARTPDDEERTAMLDALKAETAPDRKAWFLHGAGQPEAAALTDSLVAIFREAGWATDSREVTGIMLKPGIAMLSAEETPPDWVGAAVLAMQASGLQPKIGSAYRAYYEEKKKENPAWPGVPMTNEQIFVIVVGPAS